jgi:hypothetical protein
VIISAEQVAAELEQDIVSLNTSIGLFCDDKFLSGHFSYSVLLSMVVRCPAKLPLVSFFFLSL